MCVAAAATLALAALTVNASALAPADSITSVALGWLPLTYLDVARVVGTAGYGLISGCGVSAFAACIVLAASLPVMVAAAYMVVRAQRARSLRVRDSSCAIRI